MSGGFARLVAAGFLAGALATGALAAGPEITRARVLHAATLAERILLLQARIGEGILAPRARRALGEAVRDLDGAVAAIARGAPPGEVRENAALLAIIAREYGGWALRAATHDNARRLGERAEEVEWAAAKVARLWPETGFVGADAALEAEHAALAAQRVARLALWRRWKLGGTDDAAERGRLREALVALAQAARGLPEIAPELQLAQNQSVFLLEAAASGEARAVEHAAKAADNVYESMGRLGALVEARGR